MITSRSLARNTKLWAACGVLAIVSLSLVLAAGCASGGSPAQTQLSGSAKMHTYNEAPADEVGARFFYSQEEKDDPSTAWDERRTVWSTVETIPSGAESRIGLETALYSAQSPYPAFTKWSSDPGAGDKERIELTSEARVYIVNNWSKPITITAVSAPEEDLFYRMPTSAAEINKATMGNDGRSLHDWLKEGPGLYASQCLPFLFPHGEELTEDDYQDTWFKSFYYATDLLTVLEGARSKYLDPVEVDYTEIQGEEIAVGSRSSKPMMITLHFAGEEGMNPWNPVGWPYCTNEMLVLAFSTYFGVTVDFTYPPDP